MRIAGWGTAASFEGPSNVEQFLDELVKHPEYHTNLQRCLVRAYRVPCTREKLTIAETAKSEADAERAGELLLPRVDAIAAGDYILVVLLQRAAPPSTTGTCLHSIVFPSVARSSLTWSCALCVRCVVALCRGRKRWWRRWRDRSSRRDRGKTERRYVPRTLCSILNRPATHAHILFSSITTRTNCRQKREPYNRVPALQAQR